MRADGIHDRGTARNGAAAQIIAVRKSTRKHHKIGAFGKIMIGVPDFLWRVARGLMQRPDHIAFAIGTGENDDGGFHGAHPTNSMR